MSVDDDGFEPLRRLRPDQDETDPADAGVFTRLKDQLMTTIEPDHRPPANPLSVPDVYPRLAYDDEHAAVDFLTRVFRLVEIREARSEQGDKILAWLRVSGGNGVVMVGRTEETVHLIASPRRRGGTTVQLHVYVPDVDAHHAHAVAQGADITRDLEDMFFGERRYEATDLEGHRWAFAERHADIRARGGVVPDDVPEDC